MIERLRLHGIEFETLTAPRSLKLDRVRLSDPVVQRPQDGRIPLKATFKHENTSQLLPAGTVRVPYDQPLGLLAAALLEPEAPDSFLGWGLFPEMLSAPSTAEDFVLAAIADALLAADEAVRTTFMAKLAAEPGFRADPQGRLAWLLAHLPEQPAGPLVYPVLRETEPDP